MEASMQSLFGLVQYQHESKSDARILVFGCLGGIRLLQSIKRTVMPFSFDLDDKMLAAVAEVDIGSSTSNV